MRRPLPLLGVARNTLPCSDPALRTEKGRRAVIRVHRHRSRGPMCHHPARLCTPTGRSAARGAAVTLAPERPGRRKPVVEAAHRQSPVKELRLTYCSEHETAAVADPRSTPCAGRTPRPGTHRRRAGRRAGRSSRGGVREPWHPLAGRPDQCGDRVGARAHGSSAKPSTSTSALQYGVETPCGQPSRGCLRLEPTSPLLVRSQDPSRNAKRPRSRRTWGAGALGAECCYFRISLILATLPSAV